MQKKFRITILGATGVTGRQAYRYLADVAPSGFSWAIAGRSRERLEALVARNPARNSAAGIVIADCEDPRSIDRLVADTDVVIHLAGPYAKHAESCFDRCIAHGTDYLDIGGETFFIRDMIRNYHARAARRGVKLIPTAGYESLPFDLLLLMAAREMRTQFEAPVGHMKIVTTFLRSGPIVDNRVSGGSLGTMLNILDGDLENAYGDPSCLLPDSAPRKAVRRRNRIRYHAGVDEDTGAITAPLIPAPFLNVPVLLRSVHLHPESADLFTPYFRYEDSMTVGFFAEEEGKQWKAARGLAKRNRMTAMAMAGPRFLRGLIKRRIESLNMKPGDGPREDSLECVDYRLDGFARGPGGQELRVVLTGKGHPGYLSTARITVAAALALCLDRAELPPSSGVLTPATGLGLALESRLRDAGIEMALAS